LKPAEEETWSKLATRRTKDAEKVGNPRNKRRGENWQPARDEAQIKLASRGKRDKN